MTKPGVGKDGARIQQRLRWLAVLQQKQRRIAADPEQYYLHKIRQMIARLLSEPEWYPKPDCEEVQILKEAEVWLAGQGCPPVEPSERNLEKIEAELRELGYL